MAGAVWVWPAIDGRTVVAIAEEAVKAQAAVISTSFFIFRPLEMPRFVYSLTPSLPVRRFSVKPVHGALILDRDASVSLVPIQDEAESGLEHHLAQVRRCDMDVISNSKNIRRFDSGFILSSSRHPMMYQN